MVVEDPYLRAALASAPQFLARLNDFVLSHRLEERPALILQARLTDSRELSVRDDDHLAILRTGNPSRNWWNGFSQSERGAAASFAGIEMHSSSQDPSWASELRTDGHVVAGAWRLHRQRDAKGEEIAVLPYFFADIFRDFVKIVGAFHARLVAPATYELTATLWRANQLWLGSESMLGSNLVLLQPTRLPHLQWPIRCGSSVTELEYVAKLMTADFRGAFAERVT